MAGAFSDGPYGIQNADDFFRRGYYPYAFNPEIGSVGVPVAETLTCIFDHPDEQQQPIFMSISSRDFEVCVVGVERKG